VWDNHVTAEALRASLGIIPRGAVSVRVTPDRWDATVYVSFREISEDDWFSMEQFAARLQALLGQPARIRIVPEIVESNSVRGHPFARAIFDEHVEWAYEVDYVEGEDS
jgi:hypothetical protein